MATLETARPFLLIAGKRAAERACDLLSSKRTVDLVLGAIVLGASAAAIHVSSIVCMSYHWHLEMHGLKDPMMRKQVNADQAGGSEEAARAD